MNWTLRISHVDLGTPLWTGMREARFTLLQSHVMTPPRRQVSWNFQQWNNSVLELHRPGCTTVRVVACVSQWSVCQRMGVAQDEPPVEFGTGTLLLTQMM